MKKMPGRADEGADAPLGPTFVRGPALAPADRLLVWLESQRRDGKPRLVRLPVILATANVGFDLARARVGAAPDALVVRANDSLLGVGLEWHAQRACQGHASCAFWVHGYFLGKVDGELQLTVVKMEAHIAPGDLEAASFVEVEGDSPTGN